MRYLIPVALLLVATGCSSLQPLPPRPGPEPERPSPSSRQTLPRRTVDHTPGVGQRTEGLPQILADEMVVAGRRAVELARSLLRTPYRYGGDDRGGFDCSGLVTFVYQGLGFELPRTAEAQAGTGQWVAPDELRPGDLVFFGDVREKPLHVGLVTSTAGQPLRMIHAATSRGVVETDIFHSRYWLDRFKFGRRVLTSD